MADDWSGLGWNPTPGHPRLATNLAEHLKGTAEVLKDTHDLLDSLTKESSHWKGKARENFVDKIADLPKYLADAKDSLRGAGKEIQSWSDSLHGMKTKAAHYEAEAKKARRQQDTAQAKYDAARKNPDLQLAGQTFSAGAELDSAQHRLDVANKEVRSAWNRLDSAQTELQDLIDAAEKLERGHSDTAQDHADRIRKHAEDHAPDGGLWSKISDWWDKHGGDVLTVAATIAGIAAIFVPVLAPVAIGLSLAAAGQHAYQYAKAGKDMWPPTSKNMSEWATLGGDALGAVPGVGPAVKGAKAAIATGRGVNAAKLTGRGMQNVRGIVEAGEAAKGATGASRAVQAVRNGAVHFKEYSKVEDPLNALFKGTVQKGAVVMGASSEGARTAAEVSQAVATGALGAPTAATLWDSSEGTAAVATTGTLGSDGVAAVGAVETPVRRISAIARAL
ncbi:hypothetical protein K378_01993 [Streptomyces sp. Amel2xB2]|uniref:putative T7SS-secreted protein n=1 Tax=Streptomyces sp. Amel2xB2 TaxID=1305829 RepID=UPI000DBA1191|nr:hypothetical protein [Streptomyces sp. Amel2xB2]RAJ69104.1 hypothetical protein K378_01993 [Streptomyces sp. Amel2xB2]